MDRDITPVDEWRLIETKPNGLPLGLGETLVALSNGYIGMRGNPPEGRDSSEHGTYINGLHETWPIRHAEDAYGLARQGQTIANAPDAKAMRLYIDDEPLVSAMLRSATTNVAWISARVCCVVGSFGAPRVESAFTSPLSAWCLSRKSMSPR